MVGKSEDGALKIVLIGDDGVECRLFCDFN